MCKPEKTAEEKREWVEKMRQAKALKAEQRAAGLLPEPEPKKRQSKQGAKASPDPPSEHRPLDAAAWNVTWRSSWEEAYRLHDARHKSSQSQWFESHCAQMEAMGLLRALDKTVSSVAKAVPTQPAAGASGVVKKPKPKQVTWGPTPVPANPPSAPSATEALLNLPAIPELDTYDFTPSPMPLWLYGVRSAEQGAGL